jgi:hypothetical protein
MTELTPSDAELAARRKLTSLTAPASQGWVHNLLFKRLDRLFDIAIRRFEALEARTAQLEQKAATDGR